jgi:hypothetical protein
MTAEDREAIAATFTNAVAVFSAWVHYGELKLSAALIVLGIGMTDLVNNSGALMDGHDLPSILGPIATVAFMGAIVAAVGIVATVGLALFRVFPPHPSRSVVFYRDVASMSVEDYEATVSGMTATQLNHHHAIEAHELATIATKKLRWTYAAMAFAGVFLVLWVTARLALTAAQ